MFESVAHAMGPAGGAGAPAGIEGMLIQFGPLVLLLFIFYFLLIRPQQKRAKEHQNMLGALRKGDRVITVGGLIGRILDIDGDEMTLDLGDSKVKVVRSSVSGVYGTTESEKKD